MGPGFPSAGGHKRPKEEADLYKNVVFISYFRELIIDET
jgi:hypothetical protein